MTRHSAVLVVCTLSLACGGDTGPSVGPGATIRILPSPAAVPQLGTLQLDATLLDAAGTAVPGATFSFSSAQPQVATVSQGGVVRSVGPSGIASITATSGTISAQTQVAVVQVPSAIEILPDPLVVPRGQTIPLGTRVLDAVGEPIADAAVTFSATPPSLLSVDASGQLTAAGGTGSGTVTMTSGSLVATAPVSVVDVASLGGLIVATSSINTGPYGVLLAPGNTVYGLGIGGSLNAGAFGTLPMQATSISGSLTIGITRNPASGRLYVTGFGADALMEVDQSSRVVLRRWVAPGIQMYDVVMAPNGEHVYVGGDDGAIHIIDAATMTQIRELHTAYPVVHLVAHPSRPFVYASGFDRAREVNVETGAVRTFSHFAAQGVAVSLAGDRLFIGTESGNLVVVSLASGTATTVALPCKFYDLVAGPDGRTLLGTCTSDGKAVIIDIGTLTVRTTITTGGSPRRASISQSGAAAVIANANGWYDHVE